MPPVKTPGHPGSIRITVSLSDRDYDSMRALADQHGVSLSWLARKAISDFLVRSATGELQLPLDLTFRTTGGPEHG
jgi:hypothetical protein